MLGELLRGATDATTAAASTGRDAAQLRRAVEAAGIPC